MSFPTTGYVEGTDEHDTPLDFFSRVAQAVGGFDIDPCASSSSRLASLNFTKEDDGLSKDWIGKVWMNPPYSDVSDWMSYGVEQVEHGDVDLLVSLVFARTSTQWWHNYARKADLYCFVEGRLSFGNSNHSAPAPSVLLIYGDYGDDLVNVCHELGHVMESSKEVSEQ